MQKHENADEGQVSKSVKQIISDFITSAKFFFWKATNFLNIYFGFYGNWP